MTQIILLRHGESEGVAARVLQGRRDYPLTERGREQIRALGRTWQARQWRFDQVFSSPQRRAWETAEIVTGYLGISEIREEPLWMERDFGQGEGVDLDIIAGWYSQRPHPAVYEPIYETGESEWQVHLRAGRAVDQLMALPEGRYLVVSHGNVINAALHMILGILPFGRAWAAGFALDPGGSAELRYDPRAGRWTLLRLNDSAFWTDR